MYIHIYIYMRYLSIDVLIYIYILQFLFGTTSFTKHRPSQLHPFTPSRRRPVRKDTTLNNKTDVERPGSSDCFTDFSGKSQISWAEPVLYIYIYIHIHIHIYISTYTYIYIYMLYIYRVSFVTLNISYIYITCVWKCCNMSPTWNLRPPFEGCPGAIWGWFLFLWFPCGHGEVAITYPDN